MKNVMRGLPSVLLSLLLLVFIGCEKKNSEPHPVGCNGKGKYTLEGTWRLNAYQNLKDGTLEPDPNPKDRGVVLTFTEKTDTIGFKGHTVVNTVSGGFSKGGSCRLKDGSFGGTKVGEPTQWSNKVWRALPGAEAYGFTKKNLYFYFNGKSEVMIFSKVK